MVRLIIQERGDDEIVIFSDELEEPIDNFLCPGYKIVIDKELDIELPVEFPMDRNLQKGM